MIWVGPFLSVVFACVSATAETAAHHPPFWKAKEKFYRRIQEERAVIVSVKTEKRADGKQTLIFAGGGQTSAPLDFTFKTSVDIDNLKKAIDYIEEIRWLGPAFAPTTKLFVRAKAYGFEAKMWFLVRTTPNSAVHFEIVQGTLKGAAGDFSFADVENPDQHKRTEIGVSGHYDFVRFPLPKMFLEFGIEVILQKMAIRMRSYVEELYKKR